MKLLILMMAIVATGAGAFNSWHTRNLFVRAALLSEAFNVTAHVKLRIADHYVRTGLMPHDNTDAGLPPAKSLFGTSVKRVAVNRGGVLIVDFEDEIGRRAMTFTPSVSEVSGLLSWNCTSDSIERSVLEKLKPSCSYLPATLESQLMHAIANRDVTGVFSLLERGAQPEAVVNGNTPLMLAAKIGEMEAVMRLLDQGAHVDNAALNSERRTPLMVAITSNHADIVGLLLSRGASVTRKDYRGQTAIDHAVATDRRLGGERYVLLVSARFNPQFAGVPRLDEPVAPTLAERSQQLQGLYGELRQAGTDCHTQRLSSLLRAEGDLKSGEQIEGQPLSAHISKPACRETLANWLKTKHSYQSAMMARFNAAVQQCDLPQTRLMLSEYPDIDVLSSEKGPSALDRAVAGGCAKVASLLIREKGLQNRLAEDILFSAIRQAPQDTMVQLVGSLLAAGANVDARDNDEQTPLAAAISLEQPVVAKYLVDAGADVSAVTANGSRPIIEASRKGYEHLVRGLLANGADVDSRDATGSTALLAAVAKGRHRLVDTLLRAGADVRVRDSNGIHAVLLAETRNLRQIRNMLTASTEMTGEL